MVDITPIVSKDVQLIQSYGGSGFRIADVRYQGAVLVTTHWTTVWPVSTLADGAEDNLAALRDAEPPVDILMIGCGKAITAVPKGLRELLKSWGVAVEQMDTGAACRTYNVLQTEGRRVAAALLPLE
jgi:uncharacterized protein